MDILKAEIAKKKRQLQNNADIIAPNKKYFKRGDLAAKQEQEYWTKHQRIAKDDEKNKDKRDEDDRGERPEQEKVALARKEVIRRLRELNEPIILFGETEYEALVRLKKLEAAEPDFSKGGGVGSNDFKAAMDKVDQEYFEEVMKTGENRDKSGTTVSVKDDGTTHEDIEVLKNELGTQSSEKDQEVILRYLKFVLKEWGNDINKKSDEEKRSTKGKMNAAMHAQTVSYMKPLFKQLKNKSFDNGLKEWRNDINKKSDEEKRSRMGKMNAAMHAQTVSYMKPLFKQLKNKKVQEDILECLVQITGYLLDRDYLRANDCYLEMAIGNAPWPIGVTMVGIHARTGREKISSRYVAHVLNDETQRKYIQGLKRLMTQAQVIFPTDPSRSVNFEPIHH